nr:hypothetical protein P5664_08125 [Bacillus subtilis]WGE04020.1 hypothetical protein P5651_10680 [Bacillus subtilis]
MLRTILMIIGAIVVIGGHYQICVLKKEHIPFNHIKMSKPAVIRKK